MFPVFLQISYLMIKKRGNLLNSLSAFFFSSSSCYNSTEISFYHEFGNKIIFYDTLFKNSFISYETKLYHELF